MNGIATKCAEPRRVLMIRCSPELHALVHADAHLAHRSVNALCCDRLAANRAPLQLAAHRLAEAALDALAAIAPLENLSTPLRAAILKLEGALRVAQIEVPIRFREAPPDRLEAGG